MKIAFIPPINKSDYLANTVIDGILWQKKEGSDFEFKIPDYLYPCPYDLKLYKLAENEFADFAQSADLVVLAWGKNATNYDLAGKINKWNKTIFIDGSELGKNNRFDANIANAVKDLSYKGIGAIDQEMLSKCSLYFRREQPYIQGILPLPFGIESRYVAHFNSRVKKDIDFACVFGQEDYPILRKEAREYLELFCKKNGFSCFTKRTKGFNFDDNNKLAGRDQFYDVLARSKVGISIGGGGFDTARFWETLGNNCILLTEKIGIYEAPSKALDYKRIWQFKDIEEFKVQLAKLASYLQNEYNQEAMKEEYEKILAEHSTKARVHTILDEVKKREL